jgi:hypothetical protein
MIFAHCTTATGRVEPAAAATANAYSRPVAVHPERQLTRAPTSRRVKAKELFIVFVEHHTASGQLRVYLFGLFAPS